MSVSAIQGNNNNTFRNTGFNNNGFTTGTIYPNSTPLPSDTVEISGKKKGLTKKQKYVTGAAVAGALTAAVLLMRGKVGAANKEIKALAEHIDFAPAKTTEEAINFAKTNLGIKKYSKDMPLDVMNWVNEGLVNINNATKGKAKICNGVTFKSCGEKKTYGFIVCDNKNACNNILYLNKDFFTNLDGTIIDQIDELVKCKALFKNPNDKFDLYNFYKNGEVSDNLLKKLNQFTEKPESFSFSDKMELAEDLRSLDNAIYALHSSPMSKLKQLLMNEEVKEVLLAHGKLPDLKQMERLTTKQQERVLVDLINTGLKQGEGIYIGYPAGNKFHAIYHEIGHMNHKIATGENFLKMSNPEQCKEAFGKVSNITKDFVNSQKKQQIAALVSDYAQESPLEFVAETYAELIKRTLHGGKKLSDEVMKLYSEYKGPSL